MIPRPCAYDSRNLTSVEYYRGQNTLTYDIWMENEENTYPLEDAIIILENGEPADSIAHYSPSEHVVHIQTDDEDMVGVQRTVIR